ncbi:MAG: TonB family protein [Bacteroidota bacterium]
MKNKNSKRTLDDIAFEGRNRDYGAYFIRKTYQGRLLRSFAYSLGFFLLILLFAGRIFRQQTAEYYYNPLLDSQVVGVNLSNNPNPVVSMEQSGGASLSVSPVPGSIVDDAEVSENKQEPQDPKSGGSDSTGTNGKNSGEKGTGNSIAESGGVDGEIYGSADLNPQFPGGIKAMQEFIKLNLQYPEIARKSNIRGTILIYVVVRRDGTLTDIKVVQGLQPDLDAEALRVVSSMPQWKPAMRAGFPVNVRCVVPISVSPLR